MKNIVKISLILLMLSINTTNLVNANELTAIQSTTNIEIEREVKIGEAFIFFSDFFKNTPESYKYINLNFKNIGFDSELKKALQVLVYHDKIINSEINLFRSKEMNSYLFYSLAKNILDIDLTLDKEKLSLKNITLNDLKFIKNTVSQIETEKENYIKQNSFNALGDKKDIFNDVYNTILNDHYKKDGIKNETLIYSAIEGLAKGAGDIHTVYFPPTESKNFGDDLEGEYEGIGSYVELTSPGVVKITSPLPGGPAEKAGIKGGDIIIKVDDKEVKRENPLNEVVSWIKGPAGTKVKLTIMRNGEELIIEVTREKIIIKNLEYKQLNNNTFLIQIRSFSSNISFDFKEALNKVNDDKNINKIIIDLRNNGGGYLDQVVEMLSLVVPKGETIATVKYDGMAKNYDSKGYDLVDLNKYNVIILQNSGTASASEIMIGTLKDYFEIKTIGENTFGKGSVQTIREYIDGSSLKYTIANWYTGKSKTAVDGIGISPDIELELDVDNLNNNGIDNQLQEAILFNK